ncbi:MAG: hypothetical protein ACK5G7_00080 [Erysipelotrichaceae bacterium]
MKKIISIIMIALLLVGCNENITNDAAEQDKYFSYYQSILDAESLQTESKYFDIEATMNIEEDNYRYSVIIDNPQIAMYNVEVMSIIDDGSLSINKKYAMPTTGVIDQPYNLVPYQVNLANFYAEGLVLDGLVDFPNVDLLVLVVWHNRDFTITYREYFDLSANYSSIDSE